MRAPAQTQTNIAASLKEMYERELKLEQNSEKFRLKMS